MTFFATRKTSVSILESNCSNFIDLAIVLIALFACNQVWKSKPPEGMSSCWLAMSGKSAICWIASMFEHGLVHSVRFKLHILIQSGTGSSGALPALLTRDLFLCSCECGQCFSKFSWLSLAKV